VLGFVKRPRLMKLPERIARRHMRSEISDPELLEKVTPGYTIGCKRILPSNRWYLDQTGRIAALWPDWTWRFRQRAGSFDPAEFELTRHASAP
jgi:cation diffusion facilitator CzcD-associated flavoprotein CzcO